MNNSSPGNIAESSLSQSEKYFAICVTVVLIPLILTGNILVMTSYKTNCRLRTRTYTFLINLAVSDLIVGGVNLPMWIFCMVNYQKSMSSPTFQMVFKFLDRFGAFASIFHLTAISIERYIAVVKPYLFHQLPKQVFFGVSAFAWSFSLLMASLTWFNTPYFHTKTFNITVCMIGFVVPAIIVVSMHYGIFRAARSLMKRTPALYNARQNNNQQQQPIHREDHKVAVTVAVISGLFIVAWLPFFLLSIIVSFCPILCIPGNTADVLRMVTAVKWLHYSNSAVNPIIYALRDEEMKNAFKRILKIKRLQAWMKNPCRAWDKHDERDVSFSQLQTTTALCPLTASYKKPDIVHI